MIYELTTVISSLCIHAAYFRKFAVSIPDHHDKADIARKKGFTWIFWLPSGYKSYVYTTLEFIKCAITLCLKNLYTLMLINPSFWLK